MSQHLVSTMMLQHCDSVSDGFFFSRCLVRVRSVAGEEPGTAENTPGKAEKSQSASQSAGEEPVKAENTPGKAEPPLKKHKSCPTTEKDSDVSSDDDSSSDDDEDSDK